MTSKKRSGGTIRLMASDKDTNGSEPSGPSELERFEAFAKRLISVPKAEIDKARKRNEKGKTARRTN
jgi:hypothetical protein